MSIMSRVALSACVVVGVIITVWLAQPKHLRELDTKGPGSDTLVWECTGGYCTGPGL